MWTFNFQCLVCDQHRWSKQIRKDLKAATEIRHKETAHLVAKAMSSCGITVFAGIDSDDHVCRSPCGEKCRMFSSEFLYYVRTPSFVVSGNMVVCGSSVRIRGFSSPGLPNNLLEVPRIRKDVLNVL